MPRTKPPHQPTDASRQLVQLHATVGTTQEDIGRILGIDRKTLRKYYRDELDVGLVKANAAIGGALFNKAKGGDTTAMIFWMKTRAGWREKQEIDHTSSDGTMTPKPLDLANVPDEVLKAFVSAADATSND